MDLAQKSEGRWHRDAAIVRQMSSPKLPKYFHNIMKSNVCVNMTNSSSFH